MNKELVEKMHYIWFKQCNDNQDLSYRYMYRISVITGLAKNHKIKTTNLLKIYFIDNLEVKSIYELYGNDKEILEQLENLKLGERHD